MLDSTDIRHFLNRIMPVLVCLLAAGAAYWLYRESPDSHGIHGVAEAREYTVSSVEAGCLAAIEVVQGQRVSRGQVLATLDKQILEQQIRVAESELRELEAQISAEGKSLDLSGLQTDRTFLSDLEQVEIDLEEARADCAQNRAELSGTQEEISRQRALVQRHLASAERMHELQVRCTTLQEIVASCTSGVQTLEKRRQAAQQRLDEWRSMRGTGADGNANQEQLRPLEFRVARQQEQLHLLKIRARNMVLHAPVDGYVVKVNAEAGDVLTPGDPLMIIVEAHPQQVIAYLEEDRGHQVLAGTKAFMYRRGTADAAVEGTVADVAGTVSQMPSRLWPTPARPRWGRQIFIRLDAEHQLSPGEILDITLRQTQDMTRFAFHAAASAGAGALGKQNASPLVIPSGLRSRSRFEPSGIVWLQSLQRYLSVSDDTGWEGIHENSPWIFAIDRNGIVDPEPLVIAGVERFNDLEGIAASPDGRIYLIASQLVEGSGNLRPIKTLFISARLQAKTIRAENHVFFRDLIEEAGRSNPTFFASLGLDNNQRQDAPNFEIEGLAWHQGALFFGLKNPLDSAGRALIWKLENPDSLFQRKSLSGASLKLWKKARLPLEGTRAGISELLFLPDNTLLVAATHTEGGALFHAMVSSDGELSIRTLRTFAGLKPEGLCLSPDNRLVVVFDQKQHDPLWIQMELPR